MKVKRTAEMSQLEREVIKMIHKDVRGTPDDGSWRKYEKEFIYEGKRYIVKLSFKVDRQYFTYRNFSIAHSLETVFLNQNASLH